MAKFTEQQAREQLLLEAKTRATMDAIGKRPLTSMERICAFALADMILTARGLDAPASAILASWTCKASREAVELLLPLVDPEGFFRLPLPPCLNH